MDNWHGYKCEEFDFENAYAIVVFPNVKPNGKLALKTEYFEEFPKMQIDLLEKGYHLAYIKNINRWGRDEDLKRKADFVDYVSTKYNLSKKCVPVGLSCGGLFAIKFAGNYPDMVSVIYLDAPVVNILSCPCSMGANKNQPIPRKEMYDALGLDDISILSYRKHPLDYIPVLVENKIPVVMVYGDVDDVVPYNENGILVEQAYKNANIPIQIHVKHGCGHHPHCLEDNTEVLKFIEKYDI